MLNNFLLRVCDLDSMCRVNIQKKDNLVLKKRFYLSKSLVLQGWISRSLIILDSSDTIYYIGQYAVDRLNSKSHEGLRSLRVGSWNS